MNTITNDKIKCGIALAALQYVMDPEIGLNVVDLGLIYRMDFDEVGKNVNCSMTLTTQFCPMGQSITFGVINALQNIFTDHNIDLDLTFDPAWNHAMISEEGQIFLNK